MIYYLNIVGDKLRNIFESEKFIDKYNGYSEDKEFLEFLKYKK